jgi:hypothetical protein
LGEDDRPKAEGRLATHKQEDFYRITVMHERRNRVERHTTATSPFASPEAIAEQRIA